MRPIVVPTIASTDPPTNALSVVHSDGGEFPKYRFWDRNPDAVVVNTDVGTAHDAAS
jgi:glycerol dehydrogenase